NSIYVNEFFKRNDWVELFNTTSQPIDVDGMYLSDDPDKPKKYQISKQIASNPTAQVNTVIPPHGYLVVWCDKLEPLSQLHASFKLDADGGNVLLTAADESWSDHLTYTAMKSTATVGRYPDGTSHVVAMNVPTIARANIASSYDVEVSQPEQSGITDSTIMAQQPSGQTFNLKGQSVQGHLAPGIYIRNGRKVVVK
ncbi:MAG: lamin tail domain-containing protein, partial [Prevotella sp.]|nr:lamin tail domain-containing protein [Prevotella sp.]